MEMNFLRLRAQTLSFKQIHDNISEFLSNENCAWLVPESNEVIRYNRECHFARPESCCTEYETNFKLISEFTSGPVNDLCIKEESKENLNGKITAKFFNNSNNGSRNVGDILTINGPEISVECKITNIKQENYDRKFGIIQVANIFFERKYKTAIMRVDFVDNLLRGGNAVLDCVDGNYSSSCRPFYSANSFVRLRANEIPPEEMTLAMNDCPSSTTPLEFNDGALEYLERDQQFIVYLVMTYWDGEAWRYKVSHTFDWFLYWYWDRYDFRCEFGINRHATVPDLPAINIFRTCNEDQVMHWIDLLNNEFQIYEYPDFVFDKAKFLACIKKAVLDIN